MEPSLLSFENYKLYIQAYVRAQPRKGFGLKARIAAAAGCRAAYVTQVLTGPSHFSLEQGDRLNRLFRHNDLESDYFLALLQLARAGTDSLRNRIRKQLGAYQSRRLSLKDRIGPMKELSEAELHEFFGRWYLVAVQIAATVPRLKARKTLGSALGIADNTLEDALAFLVAKGLLKEERGRLSPGTTRLFVGNDSPAAKSHHANWRVRAIHSLDRTADPGLPRDMHYTSVVSISASDARVIHERLLREVEALRSIVKASPEEEVHALLFDFFRVDSQS